MNSPRQSPEEIINRKAIDLRDMVKYLSVKTIIDSRGNLSIIEGLSDIPFEIKRIYYIWDNKDNSPRGSHAHKELWQAFIAMHGSCKLVVDNGYAKHEFMLGDARKCLILPPGFWREVQEFSSECVLLILASDIYKESDYIRSYEEFISYVNR